MLRRTKGKLQAVVLLFVIISAPVFTFLSIMNYNNRIDYYSNLLRKQNAETHFSTKDKAGIYGLNIIMGFVAYPFYPEASIETLLLIFPADERKRVKYSDFMLKSSKIGAVIKEVIQGLKSSDKQKLTVKKKIRWSTSEYAMGSPESRVALALNPMELEITALKKNGRVNISISAKIFITYPKRLKVVLLVFPKITIEEGLFWILQKEGWLFPYQMEWKHEYDVDLS